MIFLSTARVILRRFTDADADDMVAMNSDPAVMRYLKPQPTPEATIRDEVLPRLMGEYDRFGGLGSWCGRAADGTFLGWYMLRPVPETERILEVGYRLPRSVWGQGLATEATLALVDKAFTGTDARIVSANTMAVNLGSRRVLEKAGLRHVHTWWPEFAEPVEGAEQGDVVYEISREDWLTER